VILMPVIGAGKSMANLIPKLQERSGIGGEQEWWVEEPITGEEFPFAYGPKDFKRRSIDGLGDDWPIGYEDIKPYYDRIDKLIGVFGTNEGLENDPDGFFPSSP